MVIYHLRPADMTAKDNTITGMYSEVTKLRKGTVIILRLMMCLSTCSHSRLLKYSSLISGLELQTMMLHLHF